MHLLAVVLLIGLSSADFGGEHHHHHGDDHHHHGDGHEARAGDTVDLHHGQHCSDVSYWSTVQRRPKNTVCCNTRFVKKCKEITQEVCLDVTEIACKAVAWADCRMEMGQQDGNKCNWVDRLFPEQDCENEERKVFHNKQIPECRNVTKQNCVTNWEVNKNGEKEWTGNENCTPVTWKECKLVDTKVPFTVTESKCSTVKNIPWMDVENSTTTEMTSSMKCQVKYSTNCLPVARKDCTTVTYQECEEVPEDDCVPKETWEPFQEKFHKKKCLLPTNTAYKTKEVDLKTSEDEPQFEAEPQIEGSGPVEAFENEKKGRAQPTYNRGRRQSWIPVNDKNRRATERAGTAINKSQYPLLPPVSSYVL